MRRHWRQSWPVIAVIACIAIVAVLCLMGSSASGTAPRTRERSGFGSGQVLLEHGIVDTVIAAGGRPYVALEQGATARDTLERLAIAGGRTLAHRGLGQHLDGGLEFDGSLWLVTTGVDGRRVSDALWRLDPRTLAVRSRAPLPGDTAFGAGNQPLAGVGGRLWLAYGDRLVQIDPRTGAFGVSRHLAKARQMGIIAGPGGHTIVVSAGDGRGRGWLQERDAVTGAFEATSRNYLGVAEPWLGGVSGHRLWITEATGMMGYAQAVSLPTMRPFRTPGLAQEASNAIEVRVDGGILFVSDGKSRQANYCGSAVSGAARVPLPVDARDGGRLTAVGPDRIYYLGRPTRSAPFGPLMTALIPAACR